MITSGRIKTSDCPTPTPYALTVLLGFPRSGTTLLYRLLESHSMIDGIIEPYQQGRKTGYNTSNIFLLAQDNAIELTPNRTLLVKETSTRSVNFENSINLLNCSKDNEIFTTVILLLRSPTESFLSQVEASRLYWPDKRLTEANEETFKMFCGSCILSLKLLLRHIRGHRFRITRYFDLCKNPQLELARLLAMIPHRVENSQLKLRPGPKGGGDPKAYTKDKVIHSSRAEEANLFLSGIPNLPIFNQIRLVEDLIGQNNIPDNLLLDSLSRIVFLGEV